jgi:hypothetical protein
MMSVGAVQFSKSMRLQANHDTIPADVKLKIDSQNPSFPLRYQAENIRSWSYGFSSLDSRPLTPVRPPTPQSRLPSVVTHLYCYAKGSR